MKMDKVAGSQNNEFFTPKYAVKPILKYLEKDKIIWCPFDTEESNFVKMLKERGFNVIATHLDNGIDFFEYEPEYYDVIVSNPPYSLKAKVFERLFKLKKPFAMLVGVVGLFESKHRFDLFKKNDFEIMYLNKRVAFFKDFKEQKPSLNPPFSSVYLCSKLLPHQIIFEEIIKPKYFNKQSPTSQTKSLRDFPNGEHNMGLEVPTSSSPKSPTATSPNPNIISNKKLNYEVDKNGN